MKKLLLSIATVLFLLSSCNTDVKKNEADAATTQEDSTIVDKVLNEEPVSEAPNLEKMQKIEELVKKTAKVSLPFTLNESNEKAFDLDLDYHSYFKEFINLDIENLKVQVLHQVDIHEDYYAILIKSWVVDERMFDDITLYTISKNDGTVYEFSEELIGVEGTSVTAKFSKEGEITVVSKYYPDDDYTALLVFNETKYKMQANGTFLQTQKPIRYFDKFVTEYSLIGVDKNLAEEARSDFNLIDNSQHIADYINTTAQQIIDIVDYSIKTYKPNAENREEFAYLGELYPGLDVSFGEDGASIEVTYDYYYLYVKAESTPEKDDDLFFEAYLNGNEIPEYGHYLPKFRAFGYIDFETRYSMLGSGKCYDVLLKIENALNQETNFKEPLKELKAGIFSDLEMYNTEFGYSKEKTLEYIDKILAEITLTEAEIKQIQAIKKYVSSASDDSFNYTEMM